MRLDIGCARRASSARTVSAIFPEQYPRQGRLQDMAVGEPKECIGTDVTEPHPVSSMGHRYNMTVIDNFSRWAEAYSVRNR